MFYAKSWAHEMEIENTSVCLKNEKFNENLQIMYDGDNRALNDSRVEPCVVNSCICMENGEHSGAIEGSGVNPLKTIFFSFKR